MDMTKDVFRIIRKARALQNQFQHRRLHLELERKKKLSKNFSLILRIGAARILDDL